MTRKQKLCFAVTAEIKMILGIVVHRCKLFYCRTNVRATQSFKNRKFLSVEDGLATLKITQEELDFKNLGTYIGLVHLFLSCALTLTIT